MRMTRLTGITAAASLLVFGGQATVWAQGGKTPTYPAIPLSVMVEVGDPWKITGDGSAYVNGAPDGTTANIDKYGNLIITFGRPITFDYSEPPGGVGPISGDYDTSYVSTLNAGGKALQNLTFSESHNESQCIKLNWQYDIPSGWMRHGFNRGFDQYAQDNTSYVVVTRTGEETWMVEPAAGACGSYTNPAGVAKVFSQVSRKGKWVVTEYGNYSLPFKLTLTRKP
jgi:hypothetical protein